MWFLCSNDARVSRILVTNMLNWLVGGGWALMLKTAAKKLTWNKLYTLRPCVFLCSLCSSRNFWRHRRRETMKEIKCERENSNRQTANKPPVWQVLTAEVFAQCRQVSKGFNTARGEAVFRSLNVILSASFKRNSMRTACLALAAKSIWTETFQLWTLSMTSGKEDLRVIII